MKPLRNNFCQRIEMTKVEDSIFVVWCVYKRWGGDYGANRIEESLHFTISMNKTMNV